MFSPQQKNGRGIMEKENATAILYAFKLTS